jgi:N-methylhydantoinase A
MPRYERGALPTGQPVAGPALIEDEWSTIVVYPGQRSTSDRLGNLLIETGP